MANLNLPTNPSDGQVVTHENTKFIYSSSKNVWTRQSLNARFEQIVPSTNTSVSTVSVSGTTLVFNKADGSTSNVSLTSLSSGLGTVYVNESDLPSSGVQAGDHAFVTATNDLYIRTATQWRSIDSINLTPTISASISSHSFGTVGESIDITYTTSEPEGTPVTVTTSNSGITNTSQVDISHHTGNNTVTVVAGASELSGGTLTISVTDGTNIGTAAITLDVGYSVWTSASEQVSLPVTGLSSGAAFGEACAISTNGNLAIVGAPENNNGNSTQGFANIYERSGTTWSLVQTLTANSPSHGSNVGNNSRFGRAFAMSSDGETIAISEPTYYRSGGNGRVHVYVKSGSSWAHEATFNWSGHGGNTPYRYGTSLGMSDTGDELVIGALGGTSSISNAGFAIIHKRTGTSWDNGTLITASDAESGANFGHDVSMSGNGLYVVSGAYEKSKVYVYKYDSGAWTEQAILLGSDRSGSDRAGFAVSIDQDGNTVAFGAPYEDGPAATSGGDDSNLDSTNTSGQVYIFVRSGTTWTEQAIIHAPVRHKDQEFGRALDISNNGNIVAIASPNQGNPHPTRRGALYWAERTGTSWAVTGGPIFNSDHASLNRFVYNKGGIEISGDGETTVAGSHEFNSTRGAAYIFVA